MNDDRFNPSGEVSKDQRPRQSNYQLDDADKRAIINMLQTNRETCIEEITRYQMAIEYQEIKYQQILAQEAVVAAL